MEQWACYLLKGGQRKPFDKVVTFKRLEGSKIMNHQNTNDVLHTLYFWTYTHSPLYQKGST